MRWTQAEVRAIAEGEAASDVAGAIPAGLAADARDAWRHGYARGWSGLGQSTRSEGKPATHFKAGWQAGWKVAKAAVKKETEAEKDIKAAAAVRLRKQVPRSLWTQAQQDAYADGWTCGRRGLIPVATHRYRGPLLEHIALWHVGWRQGLLALQELGDLQPGDVGEPPPPDKIAEPSPTAPVSPRTQSDRQRAYRARKKSRSLDVSAETHDLLRRLCERDQLTIDAALQSALNAALTSPGDNGKLR